MFVHGCFWHRCETCSLPQPKANAEFWREKFERNVDRDREAAANLSQAGWTVLTVWEHELRSDIIAVARRVADHVSELRRRP